MKSSLIRFLSISIYATLIFIVIWQRIELTHLRNTPQSKSPSPQPDPTNTISSQENTRHQSYEDSDENKPELWNWALVESPDYRIYISNLRKIGCPEETIQDIIKADVGKLFQQRRRDFEASLPPIEYWKSGTLNRGGYTPEQLDGLKEIQKEKEQVLKTLLGSRFKPASGNIVTELMTNPSTIYDRQLGFLEEGKRQAVVDTYMSFQDDIARGSTEGGMTWEEIQQARKERDDALSQLLTPEEKYEVDLRQKVIAANAVDMNSSAQERIEANMAYDKELRSLLGDQRYGEYAMTKDRKFQILNHFAEPMGVHRSRVIEAYNIQNLAQEAVQNLNSQPGLTSEGRNQATKQIIDETDSALQRAFGTEAFEEYRKNGAYMKFRAMIGLPHQPAQGDGQ